MKRTAFARRHAGLIGLALLVTVGCTPRNAGDESPERRRSDAASHAVRARKLKKIMAEIDYLRSQRLPQELDAATGRAERIDDIRTAADSLAHAAEDIPSVLSEVRLSKSDEDLFYQLAEQLVLHRWLRMRASRNSKGSEALFINNEGGRLNRNGVYLAVTRAAEQIGLHNPKSDRTEPFLTPLLSPLVHDASPKSRHVSRIHPGAARRREEGSYRHL